MSNVPKLRFKEFSGVWEEKSINNIASIKGRIGYKGYTKSDLVNEGKGAITLGGTNIKNNLLNLDNNTYIKWEKYYESPEIMIEPNQIIFVQRGNNLGDCALIKTDIGKATINPSMMLIKNIKCNEYYFYSILIGARIQKKVKSVKTTTAIPMISQGQLGKFTFFITTKQEQEKIASFLSSVDAKIEQLTSKAKLLKEYKKGVMQKIFSQEIRFKDDDGSEFPEWVERKVDEFMELTRGHVLAVPKMNQEANERYKYPVYSSQTKNNGLTGYFTDYLFEDCITWTTDGANAGDVKYRKGKFYCTNVCGVLKSDKGYANICISEILNSVSKRYVSYVGNPKLMNNVMAKIKITIPSSTKEQTKIANFLSSIDSKIEQVQKQLNSTKEFKKALLQQMFV